MSNWRKSMAAVAKAAVFLDANVLLEVLLKRRQSAAALAVINKHIEDLASSTLTAHIAVYFAQKSVGLPGLRDFLDSFRLLSLTADDFNWAYANHLDGDFEDALQLGVAISGGCSQFYTFDRALYRRYHKIKQIDIKLIGGK